MQFQTHTPSLPPSLFFLFHSRQWLAWTDNVQLSSSRPPPPHDSTSTNICCIQSGFGQGGEGVDAEVKPISMQIVMTSCVHSPITPPPPRVHSSSSSSVFSVALPGAAGKDVWTLNGSLLLTSYCPARFPTSSSQWTSLTLIHAVLVLCTNTTHMQIQNTGTCTSLFTDTSFLQTVSLMAWTGHMKCN